jgi:type II secretory pathway pseudopilin PulG
MSWTAHSPGSRRAFTLIEMVLAMAGCAVILSAIYGVFSRAVHLRDEATARTREARVRSRALTVLRNDLLSIRVSGLTNGYAAQWKADPANPRGSFPGYLKCTATTGPQDPVTPAGDLQLIEYYIITDPNGTDSRSGMLVRAITDDFTNDAPPAPREEPLLHGVQSMEISSYLEGDWQESYEYQPADVELPSAVRVRVQMAATGSNDSPPPLELVAQPKAQLLPP